jgi:hypothetical protein
MVTYSKLIPVIALAAALAPFTAYARSNPSPLTDTAHSQVFAGQLNTQTAPGGRSASANVAAGLSPVDAEVVYAALSFVPAEN